MIAKIKASNILNEDQKIQNPAYAANTARMATKPNPSFVLHKRKL